LDVTYEHCSIFYTPATASADVSYASSTTVNCRPAAFWCWCNFLIHQFNLFVFFRVCSLMCWFPRLRHRCFHQLLFAPILTSRRHSRFLSMLVYLINFIFILIKCRVSHFNHKLVQFQLALPRSIFELFLMVEEGVVVQAPMLMELILMDTILQPINSCVIFRLSNNNQLLMQ